MTTLPIIEVTTAHSRYVIDQNRGVYARTRVHEDANTVGYGVGNAGEEREYLKITSDLEPGGPLVIVHGDGSWVRSTAIQSVNEIAAVSA